MFLGVVEFLLSQTSVCTTFLRNCAYVYGPETATLKIVVRVIKCMLLVRCFLVTKCALFHSLISRRS